MKRTKVIICLIISLCSTVAYASGSNLKEYYSTALENEQRPVIIELKDKFDRSAVYSNSMRIKNAKNRSKFVLSQMKQRRAGVQENVRKQLSILKASDIKPMILGNMITCKITKSDIGKLEQNENILRILPDVKVQVISDDETSGVTIKNANGIEKSWSVDFVQAPKVWDEIGVTGEGVVVGVIDSGVDYNHPNLNNNMWISDKYPKHGYNFVNDNDDPLDEQGHGTHCAGIIAGSNDKGIACGVAPGAKIMALRILDGKGFGYFGSFLQAINFGVENGVNLFSMSLQYPVVSHYRNIARTVFDDLESLDIIAVSAAANFGSINQDGTRKYDLTQIRIPGSIPSPWINEDIPVKGGTSAAFVVGSIDKYSKLSSFSSCGPAFWENDTYGDYPCLEGVLPGLIRPDVVAPGSEIVSLLCGSEYYVLMSGTSMATPCVAGIVALMKSKNPDLTIAQIAEILENTSTKQVEKKNNMTGSGIVNAFDAVSATMLENPSRLWFDSENSKLTWNEPMNSTGIKGYNIYCNNKKISETSVSKTAYTISGFNSGDIFNVTSVYDKGESAMSNSIYVPEKRRVLAPIGVIAKQNTQFNSVKISWSCPVDTSFTLSFWKYTYSSNRIQALLDVPCYAVKFPAEYFKDLSGWTAKYVVFDQIIEESSAKVVVYSGDNKILEKDVESDCHSDIRVSLAEVADRIDYTKDLIIRFYLTFDPESYIMNEPDVDDSKTLKGINFYSLDNGATWNDFTGITGTGNLKVALQLSQPDRTLKYTADINPVIYGYNVYQDNVKINDRPVYDTYYKVNVRDSGIYNFRVSSIIDDEEIFSALSFPVTVELPEQVNPKPVITGIEQDGELVTIKWDYENGDEKTGYNIYQNNEYIVKVTGKKYYTISNVSEGLNYYTVEAGLPGNRVARSVDYEFDVKSGKVAPGKFSAVLNSNIVSLDWVNDFYELKHYNNNISSDYTFMPNENLKDYYIGVKWDGLDLNSFISKTIKEIRFNCGYYKTMSLKVYKNNSVIFEKKISANGDFSFLNITLDEPLTIHKDDEILVSVQGLTYSFIRGFRYGEGETSGQGSLFSLDGVNWSNVSVYNNMGFIGNWLISLLVTDTPEDDIAYSARPSSYTIYRNDSPIKYLEGTQYSYSDELNESGIYTYTVKANYGMIASDRSQIQTVNYDASGVKPSISVSPNIYCIGNVITVEGSSTDGNLSVYSIDGKLLIKRNIIQGRNQIETNLSPGIYNVIVGNDLSVQNEKVIIK